MRVPRALYLAFHPLSFTLRVLDGVAGSALSLRRRSRWEGDRSPRPLSFALTLAASCCVLTSPASAVPIDFPFHTVSAQVGSFSTLIPNATDSSADATAFAVVDASAEGTVNGKFVSASAFASSFGQSIPAVRVKVESDQTSLNPRRKR